MYVPVLPCQSQLQGYGPTDPGVTQPVTHNSGTVDAGPWVIQPHRIQGLWMLVPALFW